eukprot:CAMPEP_0174365250 /NCGR_PEP_ID=MMETSP0811_2-20130205/76513_1 /TAXON_ID=73025 ORGANISM="Eutreptiella gymnastica-like, Strain CCMP1594" /NCGR_SAMPLE_ID=MMETSP0811_2 /ASSEMBLY_ACC=CAM_ASM_000667 /LENGTH=36 /DNA_ID= /DNA_START= /DNA_END= /DNA_ORIENTATION=
MMTLLGAAVGGAHAMNAVLRSACPRSCPSVTDTEEG